MERNNVRTRAQNISVDNLEFDCLKDPFTPNESERESKNCLRYLWHILLSVLIALQSFRLCFSFRLM